MNQNEELGGMRVMTYGIVAICLAIIVGCGYFIVNGIPEAASAPAPTATPVPTVTVTQRVTLPPITSPPKTVKVTVRVTERASRSTVRVRSSVAATLACIRKHESGGRYTAVSASGTYRGAYQMSRVYSPAWAKRAGYDTWASKTADKWPPAVQDAVAAHMGRSGWGHWSKHTSYSCPGF